MILIIYGPTASGKTSLAAEIARRFGSYVISADSMQVYRGMDVGTAKPGATDLKLCRHFLLDRCNLAERFSAGDFVHECLAILAENNTSLPVVAGGTGLYLYSLINGIHDFPPIPERLKLMVSEMTMTELSTELLKADPVTSARISAHDRKRQERALSIILHTGRKYSSWIHSDEKTVLRQKYLMINLTIPRDELYNKIKFRVESMFSNGWVEEVRNLLEHYPEDSYGFRQAIGYREICRHLRGLIDLKQLKDLIKQKTCAYAKRQLTWFNKFPHGVLTDNRQPGETLKKVESLCREFQSGKI
ncbi:MAG: tRNA (adenosine(37)-N6)-dimethylallyltransferase MiaA [Candidatus Wallbacteria bacterium]|nr:tRNA (adenosine(37)-N6)-dimethylallyltransferase MiaA [Candidatus Wallbacteria bacterium]